MTRDLNADELRNGLGSISEQESVYPDFAAPEAIARPHYTVEWGIRQTDKALVIHLYPHIVGDNVSSTWDMSFRMDERLDIAIPQIFEKENLHAGFEPSMNSFFIIVRGVIAPDLRLMVQRFLELIEGASLPR